MILCVDAAHELRDAEDHLARAEEGLARAVALQLRRDFDAERLVDPLDVARLLDDIRLALPGWGGATRTMLEARLDNSARDLREGTPIATVTARLGEWTSTVLTGVPF